MKRLLGITGAAALAVVVAYHLLSTGSFLVSLFGAGR